MGIEGEKLSPGRGRWSKDKAKNEQRRAELKVAAEYKKALNRRKYGTLGPASKVRHIDPKEWGL